MDIFSFFKSDKTPSKDALIGQFKRIQQRKQELEAEADSIRRAALQGDVDAFSTKLAKIKDEAAMLDVADEEIHRLMEVILNDEIRSTFDRLPAERESYQKAYDQAAAAAGEALGQAIGHLSSIGEAWASELVRLLTEGFSEVTQRDTYASKVEPFVDAFSNADPGALENLSGWKARLLASEKLVPNSPEAEAFVRGRLKTLLPKPEQPQPPQPYVKGGFIRGKFDHSMKPLSRGN